MNVVMIVVLFLFVAVSPAISQVEVSSGSRLNNAGQSVKKTAKVKRGSAKKKAVPKKAAAKKAATTKKKVIAKKLSESEWQKENEAIEKALKKQEAEPRWTEEKVRELNIDEFMNNLPDILSSLDEDVEKIKSNAMQVKKAIRRSEETGDYSRVSALLDKLPSYKTEKKLTPQEKEEVNKWVNEFSRTNSEDLSKNKKETPKKQEVKVSSATLIPKRVFRSTESFKLPFDIGVAFTFAGPRNEDELFPEKGFGMQSSNQTGMQLGLDLELKYQRFALRVAPLKSSDKLDLEFYGSSLGSEKIVTGPAVFFEGDIKKEENYRIFAGIGIERNRVIGAPSIGGFPANVKYKKTSLVWEFGGDWKLSEYLNLGGRYELSNSRFIHEFPGVPDQVFKRDGRLFIRISTMFRNIKIPRWFGL